MAESIDVVDELGRPLGARDRAAAHRAGDWHRVFHLLVVAQRADGPVAVLQRRAATKVVFPGLLDLTATGHLAAGERPVDGVRELREELGVDLDPAALVSLGVRRVVDDTPEGRNRELVHVHLALDDRPLTAYRPDPTEVDAVVELPLEAGLDLVHGRRPTVECHAVKVGRPPTSRLVTVADLVPEPAAATIAGEGSPGGGYWGVLLVMAVRLAGGDDRLAI